MLVFNCVLAAFALSKTASCTSFRRATSTKYIFAFGDSYSKVGWTYTGTKPSSSNIIGNPSYPGQTTSGGKNWVEYLADNYGTGLELVYDFAQGGAVVNKSLVNYGNDDLRTQVSKFYKYIAQPKSVPYTASNSVFLFWFGQNDCYRGYNQSNHEQLYNDVTVSYLSLWESMYKYGARNFVILSLGAISQSYLVKHLPSAQYDMLKDAMNLFNTKLRSAVRIFVARHSDVKYRYVDPAKAFVNVLDNYKSYGAPSPDCYKAQNKSCLWQDHFHPSIEIHNAVAKQVASYDTFSTFFTT